MSNEVEVRPAVFDWASVGMERPPIVKTSAAFEAFLARFNEGECRDA